MVSILVAFVVATIVYVLGKALLGDRVPEPFIFAASLIIFLLFVLGVVNL